MNIEGYRATAIEYLRYERDCRLVCVERSPVAGDPCVPDVLGVTPGRKVIEIEIKRSWQDFKNNYKKWSIQRRLYRPQQFYFLVPEELSERVCAAVLPHEGVLIPFGQSRYLNQPSIRVVKPATNLPTRKLTLKEMLKMAAHQTGSLCSAWAKVAKLSNSPEENLQETQKDFSTPHSES